MIGHIPHGHAVHIPYMVVTELAVLAATHQDFSPVSNLYESSSLFGFAIMVPV